MDVQDFRRSLVADAPPTGIGHALRALWWDAKGDWSKAHEAAQKDAGRDGMRVHAYLHRKEGDPDNARYWYRRAAAEPVTAALEAEWSALVGELL
jgi:hypothetical protein